MLRYTILQHALPNAAMHWDLLIDLHGAGRPPTWRLDAAPGPEFAGQATPLEPHRRVFLCYEGPLSGGRGVVTRWCSGACELEIQNDGRILARLAPDDAPTQAYTLTLPENNGPLG